MIIKRNTLLIRIILFLFFNLIFTILLAPFIIFWGPFENLKQVAVGSIELSRHPQVLHLFLSESQIEEIMHANDNNLNLGMTLTKEKTINSEGITIEDIDIKGRSFKGKVMIIKDPKRVR